MVLPISYNPSKNFLNTFYSIVFISIVLQTDISKDLSIHRENLASHTVHNKWLNTIHNQIMVMNIKLPTPNGGHP